VFFLIQWLQDTQLHHTYATIAFKDAWHINSNRFIHYCNNYLDTSSSLSLLRIFSTAISSNLDVYKKTEGERGTGIAKSNVFILLLFHNHDKQQQVKKRRKGECSRDHDRMRQGKKAPYSGQIEKDIQQ